MGFALRYVILSSFSKLMNSYELFLAVPLPVRTDLGRKIDIHVIFIKT